MGGRRYSSFRHKGKSFNTFIFFGRICENYVESYAVAKMAVSVVKYSQTSPTFCYVVSYPYHIAMKALNDFIFKMS